MDLLNSIRIERFKNITDIEIPLGGINLLIGSNNAGKSSIQQAIQFSVSIAQTTAQQGARWSQDRCPSSLSSESLIYSPLRDVEALAPYGRLQTSLEHAIKVTFNELTNSTVTIRKGRNRNITTSLEGKVLGEHLQNIENPYSMIVPGLAGIPSFEEYRPPSVVRKAAAKGDSNSVFRNILLLLSKEEGSWRSFKSKFKTVFPDYEISVRFDSNIDEHINATVTSNEVSLPIDSCGTGILQAIQILAYYYLYKPKLLILDEPDSHLHPNNQRILAILLKELHQETDCQLIISTHSRHFFDALKDDANIHWINNSSLVENSEDLERSILLEIGALDKGDQLRNGEIPCILLTEDTDVAYISLIAESSGFLPEEYQVWSYNGCSNIQIAQALNSFIIDHAPGTSVVVHRDRDYMTEQEVVEYKEGLEAVGIKVFVSVGNDAESHFVNEVHITELYPQLTRQQVSALIDECLIERRDAILEKYINTIHNRRLQDSYRGGGKPNAGAIARECTQNFDGNMRGFMHGKIVERSLRGKLQVQIGQNIDLCRVTRGIADPTLIEFAEAIWNT
ncbi:ATP-binding protein [Pseudomonas sp. SK3(2021)]|uniref:ATP-dependent nuclease n=1 Tax=Pseudomonas sp. SK3(2021) TaxID=2841064 RepID=UPI00192B8BA0|nr:ATP-binding protein [Pseudomonas sp. SK3(2021)]QQZ44484.1 ATP-binding protein [Pseudomonas sp. SK3(2021)]